MPDLDLREKIVRMIRTHKPDVIITHDPFRPYALHPDHRAVGMATTDAVYPTARDPLYFPEHYRQGLEPHKTAEIWYSRSEEHTSELQSRQYLVCRLLLEKKKQKKPWPIQ